LRAPVENTSQAVGETAGKPIGVKARDYVRAGIHIGTRGKRGKPKTMLGMAGKKNPGGV